MSKRYYWLKLKENFFKETKVALLFREPRGKEILLVYIYLLLESIKEDGILRYNEERGYTELELSRLSGFSLPLMKTALKSLIECGFVSREEDGTLVMNEFQGMVGSESESASKMRKSRMKERSHCDQNVTERKRKEIDKEIEVDVEEEGGNDNDPSRLKSMGGTLGKGVVFLTPEQDEKLLELMDIEVYNKYVEKLADFIIRKDAKVASHYQTILKWYREDCS